MKKRALIVAIAAVVVPAFASTDLPIEIVEVIGDNNQQPSQQLHSQSKLKAPVQDAGQLIRSINGMTATRRGGRGFEPIIRGQSQNQLNVMTDGAYTFGACPGRMDPPTAYTAMDNFDQLTVIKGNRSVIYGSGGSGGTLVFEHKRPELKDKNVMASVAVGNTTNMHAQDLAGNLVLGNQKSFVRVFGDTKSAENYEDGDGQSTASAFDSASWGFIAGVDVNKSHYLQYSREAVSEDDVWFAGNGMDSPWTDSVTDRLKWLYTGSGMVDSLETTLYRSDVEHLMDNYTLRNRMPMNTSGAVAPSQSNTSGGRVLATITQGSVEWRLGVDHRANERSAELYLDAGKDGSYDMLASIMWPGVEMSQSGVFAETDITVQSGDQLRLGARVDRLSSNATRANEPAGMMAAATPNTLYQSAYAVAASDRSDSAIGWVVGWDHKFSDDIVVSTNLSRSLRAADATEQFIARSAMGAQWIGNPDINPEQHHQLDVSLLSRGKKGGWSATVYGDDVRDYIERYQQDTATLYRNTGASLHGFELETDRELSKHFAGRMALSYTRGESDNGDLGQIAPLEVRGSLDYQRANWMLGTEVIAAAEQDKVNPVLDAGPTDGFVVWNLYASWQPVKAVRLQAGVENVLDSAYAYHVNTANSDPFNPDPTRVNEPGRELWFKARYLF